MEIISFHLAGQVFSINIMAVREIRGWAPVTAIAHAPAYVLGVLNLRGMVISVIDTAMRLGLPAQVPSERSAIIVAEIGGQLVGLLVENVSDMITVRDEHMQPVPEIGVSVAQTCTSAIISHGAVMISHLEPDMLVAAPALVEAA